MHLRTSARAAAILLLLTIPAGAGAQAGPEAPAGGPDTTAVGVAGGDPAPSPPAAPDDSLLAIYRDATRAALADTGLAWAVLTATADSLGPARGRLGELREAGIEGFVRVRADRDRYWYEVLAGPLADRQEAGEVERRLRRAGLAAEPLPIAAPRDRLLRGTVVAPVAAADSTAAAPDSAAAAPDSAAAPPDTAAAAPDTAAARPDAAAAPDAAGGGADGGGAAADTSGAAAPAAADTAASR